MNSKILIKFGLVAILTTLFIVQARADITTGLVGYWSLADGPGSSNVVDLSGNGNTGTLKNFSDVTYDDMWSLSSDPTNGWPYALIFTNSGAGFGTNTYVNIPDSGSLDLPSTSKAWTLSAWVNCSVAGSSEPANAGIISKGNQTAEQYALYISGGKFTTRLNNASDGGNETVSASTSIASNTWYHVVAEVQEPYSDNNYAEAQIYVNGVRQSPANNNTYTTVYITNLPVTIGCRANSSGTVNEAFEGTIDEVRIYDRFLPPSDILELYQNRALNIPNGGVGVWNGLAGSGGNATLDGTSLNYCTNLYTAPLGRADSLNDLLNVEQANSLPPSCSFGDVYYSNRTAIAVTATNLTIASGGVAIGDATGPGTMTFINSGLTYTLASSDNFGLKDGANPTALAQSGGGTLILTGNNSFSGGVTINSGTVQLGNGSSISGQELGSATTLANNGALVFNGNNNLSFNTTISGAGSVTQKGSGALSLGGNNTYSGGTTINNATLSASSMADSGGSLGTGPVSLDSAAIGYTGTGDATIRQFNGAPASTNTIDVPNGVTLALEGRVASTAAWVLNKLDTGTLLLGGQGTNSFLGMTVEAGTVILSNSVSGYAIGNPLNVGSGAMVQMANVGYASEIDNNAVAPVTVNSGGIFDLNGQSENIYSLSIAGSGGGSGVLINSAPSTSSTLQAHVILASSASIGGSGAIMLPGIISGTGPLTYSGSATLTLLNQNSYSGGTVVNSGLLDANVALSLPGNVTVNTGGTLELDDASSMNLTATLTLPASPAASIVNLAFAGTANIGSLYFGAVAQASGTWGAPGSSAVNQNAAFTGGGILNVGGSSWDANGSDASNGNNASGGGNGSWDTTSTDWWVNGNSDTVWAANNDAYFAGTAGTVTLNANETVNGLIFSTNGYTITNTDGISELVLAGEYPEIVVPAGTTAVTCDLTGGGTSMGLSVNGAGTLVLSGTNNYVGGTALNNATLNVNAISDTGASAIGNSGDLTLGTVYTPSGGMVNFTGTAGVTARNVILNGTSTSFLNVPGGSALTLNGQVKVGTNSAPQNLTKTGTGTLFLGGAVDNSSLFMAINQGEVIITKASTNNVHGLGGGTSIVGTGTVGNSAELQLSGSGGFDLYSGCILTVNSPDGWLDLNGQSDSMSTLTLSGAGPNGTGSLINSNSSAASFLTNGGSGIVLAGNTTVGGNASITLASKISGAYALTYGGSATLSLGSANTFSGGAVINPGGTIQLNNQSAAGTGTIADNGTLALNIAAGTLTNTVTGGASTVVNIIETLGDNLTLGGPMSGFAGTINCPAGPGNNAKAQILSSKVALPAAATINLAAGGTLYVADAGVVIPCAVNIYGLGNNEAYGALRLESNAVISGPVTLYGNTTMGNGHGGSVVGTISGPISQSNGSFGITFTAEPGTIVLAGTNIYTGATTISGGQLEIGGAGQLGAGNYASPLTNNAVFNYASSAAQTLSGVIAGTGVLAQSGSGLLSLTGSNIYTGPTVVSNSTTLVIAGGGCLGVTATATNYAGNVTNGGTFDYASTAGQTLSGVVSGSGELLQSGPGTLTLSGANTYTGATVITNASTLVVGSGGSINTTPLVSIPAGSTLDVSAYSSFSMLAGTTLGASGTGTTANTAATVKGATSSGATVTVAGPLALTYTPQSFSGDANHPSLFVSQISQGELVLSGHTITVNNAAGTPLGVGTYSLIQVAAGGSISLGTPTVTVTGSGLAAGTAASVSASGGSVNLVVTASAVPVPAINSVTLSGANLIFSGTNGSSGGPYYVLASTNVMLPLSQWIRIATNSFSGTGTFSVTNAVGTSPRQFFAIEIP